MAVKILNGIDVEGSMNIVASDVPNLDASKITSGTFSTDRIPNLSGIYQPIGNYLTSVPSEYLTQTEGDARYDSLGSADAVQTWVGEQNYASDAAISTAVSNYLPLSGGTLSGNLTAPSFIGRLMGGLNGAPDATIWCVSGQHTDWGIFYDEGSPDKIHFKSSGVSKANIALDTGVITTTQGNSSQWSTAYGWGNHASAGYLTSIPSSYATDAEVNSAVDVVNTRIETEVLPAISSITLASLGYTGATNANYITNNNQLTNGAGYATTSYVNTAVSNLVASAPAALNTLNELAAALGDDSNFSTTVANNIGAVNTRIDTEVLPAIDAKQNAGNYFTDGDTVLNMANNDGLVYDDTTNRMYVKLDGTNREIYHTGNFTDSSANWNTAYGWGNHASAGYLTSIPSTYATDAEVNTAVSAVDSRIDTEVLPAIASKLDSTAKAADSNLLDGLDLHTGRNNQANKVVRSNSSGYVDFGWINTTSGNTTGTLTDIYVNTNDGYIRKATPAHFRSQITDGSYDSIGSADAVNIRIDTEVLPAIPTNNNQLTNGAGYITDGNTNWNNSYGFITEASYIKAGGAGPSTENLNTIADSVVTGKLEYRGFNLASSNRPPASDNANGVITVGQHSGNYNAQLAFSSDGNMYWRDNPSTSYGSWRTVWDSDNLDAFVGATVSNDTITFTKANGGTVAVTTSDANTNTWRPIDDTPVNGVTDQSISSNWAYDHVNASNPHGTTAADVGADAAGSADAVNVRIDNEVMPAIGGITLATLGYTGATNANYITNNNQLTNGAGYTTNTGTITGVSTGTGLDGTASSGAVTITLDLSELTDMTAAVTTSVDELILLDNGAERRKRFDEIFGSAAYQASSAFDPAGTGEAAAAAVNSRIDQQVLPSIPFDNIQLANGAGYVTSSHTHTPSQVGLSNLSANGNNLAGNFTATGDITAFSDARVKENIETLPNALESVKQMRGVTYNKIGEEKQSIGVIAQELEEVVPQLVHTDEEGMKSVAYGNITALLIEALKEQQEQIEELKAKLNGFTK